MKEKVVVSSPPGVEVRGAITAQYAEILTPAALAFLAKLSRAFEPRRRQLLAAREERARRLDAGERPDFLPETAHIRASDWTIAPLPKRTSAIEISSTSMLWSSVAVIARTSCQSSSSHSSRSIR